MPPKSRGKRSDAAGRMAEGGSPRRSRSPSQPMRGAEHHGGDIPHQLRPDWSQAARPVESVGDGLQSRRAEQVRGIRLINLVRGIPWCKLRSATINRARGWATERSDVGAETTLDRWVPASRSCNPRRFVFRACPEELVRRARLLSRNSSPRLKRPHCGSS